MSTKQIKGVIIPRHDIAKNWAKAVNFIPKDSELIVYKSDEDTYDTTVTINGTTYPVQSSDKIRFKFGDGVSNVNALPFVETGSSVGGVTYEQMVEYVEQANKITDAIASVNNTLEQLINDLE